MLTIFGRYSIEYENNKLLQSSSRSVAHSRILGILQGRTYLKGSRQQIATQFGGVVLQ